MFVGRQAWRNTTAGDSVDICLSSMCAERATPPGNGTELLQVTKPGGLVVLSYAVWRRAWASATAGDAPPPISHRHSHPARSATWNELTAPCPAPDALGCGTRAALAVFPATPDGGDIHPDAA